MKLNHFYSRVVCVLLAICYLSVLSSHSQAKQIDELFKSTCNATTIELKIDPDDIVAPIVRLLAIDKYLMIEAFRNKEHIYIYDLDSERYLYNLYAEGRARNELTSITSMASYKDGFVVFSNGQLIINDSLYWGCDSDNRRMDISFPALSVVPMFDNKRSIATGTFVESNKQFALLDEDFEPIEYFEEYPSTYRVDSRDIAMGLQGKITVADGGFIYTSNFGGFCKFFTYADNSVKKCREYLYDMPNFRSASAGDMIGVAQDPNNIVGAVSTTASSNEYFMLYSYERLKSQNRTSNVIYVFDLNGTPIRKIILDRNVDFIFYCQALDKLYAIGEQQDGYIRIYNCKWRD